MFELIFIEKETANVVYAVNEVVMVRHITASEVGFTDRHGHIRSCSFPHSEVLLVERYDETKPDPRRERAFLRDSNIRKALRWL